MVVPVPRAAVQKAINEAYPLPLLPKPQLQPVPSSLGFPPNTHPVIVTHAISYDIRQGSLAIDGPLRVANILIPFTARPNDQRPYIVPLLSQIAGADPSRNDYIAGLLPALVSTAGGLPSSIGNFIPKDEAYNYDGQSPLGENLYSSSAKQALVPNQVSGPGVYPAVSDIFFTPDANPRYTLDQYKTMINQPLLFNAPANTVSLNRCQRNYYFFDNVTAQVDFRKGNVTLGAAEGGSSTLAEASEDGAGGFFGVSGFTACAQLVGYEPIAGEQCEGIKAAE